VRYRVEVRDSVRHYFRSLPLSRNGRVRLNSGLIQMVAEVPDSFRSDPANRLPGQSSCYYQFAWIFKDDARYWRPYVVVDDSTAAYGILRIVYAECQ
jgi:hypothetical protein